MFFEKDKIRTLLRTMSFALLCTGGTTVSSQAYFDCSKPPPASAGAAYYNECATSRGSSGGSSASCNPGYGLCPNGGCAPLGSVCCGDGYCGAGTTCGGGGGCVPNSNVDCGSGKSCRAGTTCGRGGGCVPRGSVDCGDGEYCSSGNICAEHSCILASSERVCSDLKHYCEAGYECNALKCEPNSGTKQYQTCKAKIDRVQALIENKPPGDVTCENANGRLARELEINQLMRGLGVCDTDDINLVQRNNEASVRYVNALQGLITSCTAKPVSPPKSPIPSPPLSLSPPGHPAPISDTCLVVGNTKVVSGSIGECEKKDGSKGHWNMTWVTSTMVRGCPKEIEFSYYDPGDEQVERFFTPLNLQTCDSPPTDTKVPK
jgi:hypothetical protein